MARPTVYVETSVISYATSRPSRDIVLAARQQVTQEWMAEAHTHYDLVVSPLVLDEAAGGDEEAAQRRLAVVQGMRELALTDDAIDLSARFIEYGVVAPSAGDDALHVAVAAVHAVDFLVTWNCRHIANASVRQGIERVCRAAGHQPPVICTPEELAHDWPG